MSDFKKMWNDTGKELDEAFKTLGKTIVKSAKLGIKKIDEWANGDDDIPEKNSDTEEKQ